jgi:nucleoside-diphosphate-sugar epimerase
MSGSSWEKDYRDPAVQGTKNCLEAAAKESSESRNHVICSVWKADEHNLMVGVKHVVVTSSFACEFSIRAIVPCRMTGRLMLVASSCS